MEVANVLEVIERDEVITSEVQLQNCSFSLLLSNASLIFSTRGTYYYFLTLVAWNDHYEAMIVGRGCSTNTIVVT